MDARDGMLVGPYRSPRQMLMEQRYAGHASIHDDETASRLGFRGGAIEGPTHMSQFVPLAYAVWGDEFLTRGCLSVHYRNPVFEGETVQAELRQPERLNQVAEIRMVRSDGAEILKGTASVEGADAPTALEARLATLSALADPVILADVQVGMTAPRLSVRMPPDQRMGDLYPFSLAEKLRVITEPSPWYAGASSPWGRPIMPFEMISVLMQYRFPPGSDFPSRGPTVDLFADQEIRLVDGPVFVDQDYELQREVVFMSGSRRTESLWSRTTLYDVGSDKAVARMLLNLASMKEAYAPYVQERTALYGPRPTA